MDPFIYVKNNEEGISIILVWGDNIVTAASSSLLMGNIKEKLRDLNMKDWDEISSFLGIPYEKGEMT